MESGARTLPIRNSRDLISGSDRYHYRSEIIWNISDLCVYLQTQIVCLVVTPSGIFDFSGHLRPRQGQKIAPSPGFLKISLVIFSLLSRFTV